MKRTNFILLIILLSFVLAIKTATAQKTASYFSQEIRFNPKIPSPEQFLGYEIGSRITEHSQVNAYLEKLAELSDRATIVEMDTFLMRI